MANEKSDRKVTLVAVHTIQAYDAEAKAMVEHKPGMRFNIEVKEGERLRKLGAATYPKKEVVVEETAADKSLDPTT